MIQGRYFHQVTALSNGSALACGGYNPATGAALSTCEMYVGGGWGTRAPMANARARHQAVKVTASTSSGFQSYVLVAGSDVSGNTGPAPERYDPSTNTWTSAASGFPSPSPSRSALTVLQNGFVLHTGGRTWSGSTALGSTAVYKYLPNSNTWTSGGSLQIARYGHSAVLFGSDVLVAGGFQLGTSELQSSELWSLSTSTSTLKGNLTRPRGESTLLLDNLGVPFLHGSGWSQQFNTTERYVNGAWVAGPPLPDPGAWFYYGRSYLLPSGNIVSLGVNLTSTFNPLGIAKLGLACPNPLPPQQPCWTAPTCDAAGNYTPSVPDPTPNPCCNNGTAYGLGTNCGDTNPCNGTETCDGQGHCQITAPLGTGEACTDPSVPATQVSPCRQTATCNGNTCVPGMQLPEGASCSLNPCKTSTCTAEGTCQDQNTPDGTICHSSDATTCRRTDTCSNGDCTVGADVVDGANAHNACTTDVCSGGVPFNSWNSHACSRPANLPPNDTNTGGMGASTSFLYQGGAPPQQGVPTGKIDEARVAVVRGRVLREDATGTLVAAQGVTARILGDADYGTTLTRDDGYFDLAVNGGGRITVVLEASDMLPLQRTVMTSPHGWSVIDDVIATKPVRATGTFVPNSGVGQVVTGALTSGPGASEYLDADPPRRARVYFPPGTHIQNHPELDPLSLRVDITEYTRGVSGPKRMPGELPALVGYTYAVDVTLRDPSCLTQGTCTEDTLPAIANPLFVKADGTTPANVYLWVDDFVGVNDLAKQVPTGSYDQAAAVWRSEASGRIIDPGAPPAAGGDFTADELALLNAGAFAPAVPGGKMLRSPLAHFSPWDCNWGIAPPAGAGGPGPLAPGGDPDDPCEASGSIIGCETQSLGEELPIVGTPFSLRYQSNRTPGYRAKVKFAIGAVPLPATPPTKTVIEVTVAGRKYSYDRPPPSAGETFTFEWDGRDAYGREVFGTQLASIRVGYEYGAVGLPDTPVFGLPGGAGAPVGNRQARTFTYWRDAELPLSRVNALAEGFGGWTLGGVDRLDVGVFGAGAVVEQGGGGRRRLSQALIETVPGTSSLSGVFDAVEGPDGAVYLGTFAFNNDSSPGQILRLSAAGDLSVIAGLGPVYSEKQENAAALTAKVFPRSLAFLPTGDLVFGDKVSVWRIDHLFGPTGFGSGGTPSMHLVAGQTVGAPASSSCPGFPNAPPNDGDGGAAVCGVLHDVYEVAVARDGAILVADHGSARALRRIAPGGSGVDVIGTVVTFADSTRTSHLTVLDSGVVFMSANQNLLRVDPDGRTSYPLGPGGGLPTTVCGGADGSDYHFTALPNEDLLVLCYDKIVRWTDGHGIQVAGTPTTSAPLSGVPPLQAKMNNGNDRSIRVTPRGDALFVDDSGHRVRRIPVAQVARDGDQYVVPSADGSTVDVFDAAGRQVAKRTALTQATLYTYEYDAASGQLTAIRDGANPLRATTVTRTDTEVRITSPDGQQTVLACPAADRYLTSITSGYQVDVPTPQLETTGVTHDVNGLLTGLTDPRGNVHRFEYDAAGRLTKDLDAYAQTNGKRLSRVDYANGYDVTLTSAEGRARVHGVRNGLPQGDVVPGGPAVQTYRSTSEGGLVSKAYQRADGSMFTRAPDGTTVDIEKLSPDPRGGVASMFPAKVTTTVGLLVSSVTEDRAPASGSLPMTFQTTVSADALPDAVTKTTFDPGGASPSWTTLSPELRKRRFVVDTMERVTRIEIGDAPFPLEPVNFTYDASTGRLTTVTQGTRTWQTTYDPSTGWVGSVSAPENLGTSFIRDTLGRPTTVTLPGNRLLSLSYDGAGNLASVTPPSRPAHAFTYDANNRLASYVPPQVTAAPLATKDTLYARDKDGLLTDANAAGVDTSYTLDVLGRLKTSTGSVARSQLFDTSGRLQSVTANGVTLAPSGYQGSLWGTVTWTGIPYTNPNNPITFGRVFDNLRRVKEWRVPAGTGTAVPLGYDKDGLLVSAGGLALTRHSQTGLLTGSSIELSSAQKVWDATTPSTYGETSHYTAWANAAGALFDVDYTRDDAGRITTKTETIQGVTTVYSYDYDAAGRLWKVLEDGALQAEYFYDANGNRLGEDGVTVTASYDEQDRLVSAHGATFEYTANGELAKRSLGGDTLYTYDTDGNLKSVARPNAPLIEYIIDGQNHRVAKKLGGTLTQGFVYDDQERIVAELDGTGAVVSRFVYATQAHSPDLVLKSTGTYRIVKDHLGSPRLVVDVATGLPAQRLDYDAWGVVTYDSTPGFQPFGFAGGPWDRDTNLVRFGARDYDPTTGRWGSKDRARIRGGLNFQAYCDDDPINLIDPSGHFPLPADPSGLGSDWKFDSTFDPNWRTMSEKYVHKSGEWLRFDKGDDSKPGHGGKDHWHHSSDPKRHLYPGDEVPDPPAMCEAFVRPMPEVDDMFNDNAPQPGDPMFPLIPFFSPGGLPEWLPFFIPAWSW